MVNLVAVLLGLVAPALLAGPAQAQAEPPPRVDRVDVVQLGGLLDPINVDLLRKTIRQAERKGGSLVLLQLDASRSSATDRQVQGALAALARTAVPVAAWIGPAGRADVSGTPAALFRAADLRGMAPGTRLDGVSPDAARAAGSVDEVSPTLADFLGRLDGRQARGRTLQTALPRVEGEPYRLSPSLRLYFAKSGLLDRTLHALGSPSAVYFLFVGGLLLVLFEFFSAGVGIAAATGALCLAASAYGLGSLPTRPLGVGLLLLAVLAFGIDIQAASPRFWTGAGTIALVVGSLTLFDPSFRPSWLALLLVIVGSLLAVLFGIPSTVRTRFSTPTIGREELVGASGVALTAIDPDGTVEINGAPWRARTFPAKIAAGAPITVFAIEGLVLEVIPEGTEFAPLRSDRER